MRQRTLWTVMAVWLAVGLSTPAALAGAKPTKRERLAFQYLAGSIRIPAAREDEPVRKTLSAGRALAYV